MTDQTSNAGARSARVEAFTFGDPEPVLDRRDLLGCVETRHNNRWYEPPVSMNTLVRAFDIPGPHSSCIRLKVNLLVAHFEASRWLGLADFRKWALDFLATGNGYLEQRNNLASRPLRLAHSLSRYTRRGLIEGRYFFTPGWRQEYEFEPDRIFHLIQEHPTQELYGVPEFLGALQAGLLGEAATLFRRRYYLNGSHAGFVFYMSEESVTNEDVDSIRKALKEAKGPGNFRNLFLHAPKGKKDGVQIIPISEVAAKDEFLNIKIVSRDEMLAAHRVPPQLLGVVPANAGGFGDVAKAADVFLRLEIVPLAIRFLELNDWLGLPAVRFPYLEQLAKSPALLEAAA
ncbi:MAG: phage portal protein [Alphaproteobacteria bacterium]|nr:MAG: phage portal protein [Alphaproteobacteria bacterium]